MHERAHTHARTRPRKVTYSSSEERLRLAPFLTVLGTHSISRSFPLPPQRMPASPAAASAAPGPAPHSHPAAFKRRRAIKHHMCTQHAVWASQQPRVSACIACGSRGYSGSALLSDVPPPPREAQTP